MLLYNGNCEFYPDTDNDWLIGILLEQMWVKLRKYVL